MIAILKPPKSAGQVFDSYQASGACPADSKVEVDNLVLVQVADDIE